MGVYGGGIWAEYSYATVNNENMISGIGSTNASSSNLNNFDYQIQGGNGAISGTQSVQGRTLYLYPRAWLGIESSSDTFQIAQPHLQLMIVCCQMVQLDLIKHLMMVF